MAPITIKKLSFAAILLLTGLTRGFSQPQYQISGYVNVIAGVNYAPYTITVTGGTWSTSDKWCATNGTLNNTSNTCVNNNGTPNVSVTWTSAGAGTLSYTPSGYSSPAATLNVTVFAVNNLINQNANAEFSPDYYPFVPLNQLYTINLQGSPVIIPPGIVSYSWQESLDGTHYSQLPDGSTQNYLLSQEFTQASTWIERVVTVNISGDIYTSTSSPIMVQAVTPVVSGLISPASVPTIVSGGNPGTFTAGTASGGSMCGGSYTYTWQTSPDNVTWTNASASGLSFSPGSLATTTYIRLLAFCGPMAGVSNTVVVNVYQPLQGGLISPMNIMIASGTDPGNLTGSAATNGDVAAGYTYTWYSSTNGTTWTEISPVVQTQNYDPGILTAPVTYFMRQVSCNGQTASSNAVEIRTGIASAPGNWIQTRAITAGAITSLSAANALTALSDVKQGTQYFDGLGRLSETVARQSSLVGNNSPTDLITPVQYDPNGRQVFSYLPYASTASAGSYDVNAMPNQNAFNATLFKAQGDNFYYGQTNYEPSPLARINGISAPGDNWTGSNRGNQTLDAANTADDSVYAWLVTNSGTVGVFGTYSFSSPYAPGTLSKDIALDENGKQVITYKDRNGNIVLKKVQLTANPDEGTGTGYSGWLCTYYIFDVWNNLRCVIQPEGVVLLSQKGWNIAAFSDSILTQQCFRYEYDARNRPVMKQVPGIQPEYFVYDNLDRVVMTQNGNLRAKSQWMVSLYESALDRPVGTGIWTNTALTLSGLLSAAYTSTSYPFTLSTVPTSGWELLTQTHYDNYTGIPSQVTANFINSGYNTSNFYSSYNVSPIYAQQMTQSTPTTAVTTQGLVTWTESEVLGTNDAQYIYVSKIYDTRARVIQEQTYNYMLGLDVSTTQYNFIGLPLIHDLLHHLGSLQTYEMATRNSYDKLERLSMVEKMVISSVTPSKWDTISTASYDAVGRMATKTIGRNPLSPGSQLETQTFEYNVRGWTLGVNRAAINGTASTPFFGYELGYDKASTIVTGTTYADQQYNGNIGGTVWKNAGDQQVKKYDFYYDPANRLTAATFNEYTGGSFNTNAGLNFSVSGISYDPNGNILTMHQMGWSGGTSSAIDALRYDYFPNSNQLQNVIDSVNNSTTTLEDFHYSPTYTAALGGTKTATATDYGYDNNGNLTMDKNKDLKSIGYNYLNLPIADTVVGTTTNGTILYTYDANGDKLAKTVNETGATVNGLSTNITTTTTYISGFIYQSLSYSNSSLSSLNYSYDLQFFGQEEGRVRALYKNASSPNTLTGLSFDYFLKDHLGDTRIVITEEQDTDIYPVLTFDGSSQVIANQNAVWDNASGQSINVAAHQVTPLPTGFSTAQNGTFCDSISKGGGAIGAAKLIRVMAGDQITASLQVTYSTASVNNSNANGFNTMWMSIANMILGSGAVTPALDGSASALQTFQENSSVVSNMFNTTWDELPQTGVPPEAYLHVLLFNDQFVFDNVNSQVFPVNSTALNATQTLRTYNAIQVPKNGYAYIYFSNESNTPVYFDNFTLTHFRGPLLETNDYYAFGLTMAATSGMAMRTPYAPNKYRYNGKELQSQEFSNGSGLEEYDYGARFYDPQLGVWHSPDPLAREYDDLSPYTASADNPIRYVDHDGRFLFTAIGAVLGGVVGGVSAAIHHKNIWKGIGKGVVSGAIAGAVVDITVATAGTGTVALVAAGALSGAAGNAVDQGLNNMDHTQKGFNFKSFGIAAGAGAVVGFAGAKIGGAISKLLINGSTGIGTTVGSGGVMGQVIPGELENIGVGVEGAAHSAPTEPIDPNRIVHIFDKAEHALDDLVAKFGSQQAAYQAVQEAAQEAYEAGHLAVGPNGILPSGDAGNIINVDGITVRLIGGRVVNGKVVISSFSRKGLP